MKKKTTKQNKNYQNNLAEIVMIVRATINIK